MNFNAPHIDYAGISPLIALTAGICVVLLAGVFERLKAAVPLLTLATLGATAGLYVWQWGERKDLVAGALRLGELGDAALRAGLPLRRLGLHRLHRHRRGNRPRGGAGRPAGAGRDRTGGDRAR